jgi:hypothetical protein
VPSPHYAVVCRQGEDGTGFSSFPLSWVWPKRNGGRPDKDLPGPHSAFLKNSPTVSNASPVASAARPKKLSGPRQHHCDPIGRRPLDHIVELGFRICA